MNEKKKTAPMQHCTGAYAFLQLSCAAPSWSERSNSGILPQIPACP